MVMIIGVRRRTAGIPQLHLQGGINNGSGGKRGEKQRQKQGRMPEKLGLQHYYRIPPLSSSVHLSNRFLKAGATWKLVLPNWPGLLYSAYESGSTHRPRRPGSMALPRCSRSRG